ncbi:hypothetical protein X801_02896 [Opisthorchis viverrini]|uniref:Uncharacterized protein n=1 Tax=Opisthorchis viverrini TaxID=6198 RepID=A0A1S8X3C4_OPIVI|nr:hypothetical protein X801_02896 [Opisthorchis viverrini]
MSVGKLEEFTATGGSLNQYVERELWLSSIQFDRSLVSPDLLNTKSFDNLSSIVFRHYDHKPFVIPERFKFNTRIQNEGASIEELVAK